MNENARFVYLHASHTKKGKSGHYGNEDAGIKKRKEKTEKERKPDLRSFTLQSIQHSLESRLTETAIYAGLFIVLESVAESFGTIVESVAKGFMDALDIMSTSHKDLFGQHSKY